MTQDDIRNVHEDIAYMKALAQDGAKAPLLGGAILVAAGLIFAAASVLHWSVDAGIVNLPPVAFATLWIGAVVVFLVVLAVLKSRLGGKPGAYSATNRASSAAWMGVGLSCFVLGVSIAIICWRTQTEAPVYLFPSLIMALYGTGWAVSASMSGSKPLWWVAIGGWVFAPMLAWLTGDPAQWLAYAAALLLLATAPGLMLMRREPSEIV